MNNPNSPDKTDIPFEFAFPAAGMPIEDSQSVVDAMQTGLYSLLLPTRSTRSGPN